jgi:hypothetical protein
MRLGRTIFVFWVALSVALLPVPGMIAHAASSDLSLRAPDCCADCCHAITQCGSVGGCTLNCFSTFGAVAPAPGVIVARRQRTQNVGRRRPIARPSQCHLYPHLECETFSKVVEAICDCALDPFCAGTVGKIT